jgi:hypothetical protein
MRLPISASEPIEKNEQLEKDAFIMNPFVGKELLTAKEAIDCINHLSGVLLAWVLQK